VLRQALYGTGESRDAAPGDDEEAES
jgi:hypothetical protein